MRVRVVVAGLVASVLLAGCGGWRIWPFSRARAPSPPAAQAPVDASPVARAPVDVRSADEARAACPNYADALDARFPRDAIIRGLDNGHATVRFEVDGDRVTVLSVTSSDPTFGNAASDAVRRLRCRSDTPSQYQIPFDWRSTR